MASSSCRKRKHSDVDKAVCRTGSIDMSRTVVLLHSQIDTIKQDRIIHGRLRTLLEGVETFDSGSKCEGFIQNFQAEKIFLIISMEFASAIISKLHHLPQLCRIYIYKDDEVDHSWTDKYQKVAAVFGDLNHLLTYVMMDIHIHYKNSTDQSDTKQSTAVFGSTWDYGDLPVSSRFQKLLETLCSKNYASYCQQRFIDEYRSDCEASGTKESSLDEFERMYKKEDAVKWYTKDCFLYRCLNKALRQENIKYILLLHFFIYDLFHQIRSIGLSDRRSTETTVYRGQRMTKDELYYWNYSEEAHYMYVNAFFSTTYDRNVALQFAQIHPSEKNDYQSILFEIKIKQTDGEENVGIFADVENYSYMKHEREVLIAIGNAFVIDGVEYDEKEGIWLIQLTLDHYGMGQNNWCDDPDTVPKVNDDDDEDLIEDDDDKHTHGCRIYSTRSDATFIQIGYLLQSKLNMANDYTEILDYYSLLRQLLPDAFSIEASHVGLGLLALEQKNYQSSMEHQQKALEFYSKTLLSNQCDHYTRCILLIIYNCIGSIYFAQNDFTKAIDCYTKLLEDQSNFSCFYAWTMGQILNRFVYIARVWKESDQFERIIRLLDSLEQIKKTNLICSGYFDCWLQRLSIADHGLIGANFLDLVISVTSSENDPTEINEDLNLEFMRKNEIFIEKVVESKILDCHDRMYGQLGILYGRLKRMDLALPWFKKAIDECSKTRIEKFNYPDRCTYLDLLSYFYRENNEFDLSWYYLQLAYNIQDQTADNKEPTGNFTMDRFYLKAADISKRKMNFSETIQYCREALKINPKCVEALERLADVYDQLGNYAEEKECYRQALELTTRYDESGRDQLYRIAKKLKNYRDKLEHCSRKESAANQISFEH